METIHATCISVFGRGVLLRGESGSGKSDLGLRLIDRGAHLVADDRVSVNIVDGVPLAVPPPAIAGLIEVRGIGVLRMAYTLEAAVALVVDCVAGDAVDRLPEPATVAICGVPVPLVRVAAFEESAAIKVELAVRKANGDILAVD